MAFETRMATQSSEWHFLHNVPRLQNGEDPYTWTGQNTAEVNPSASHVTLRQSRSSILPELLQSIRDGGHETTEEEEWRVMSEFFDFDAAVEEDLFDFDTGEALERVVEISSQEVNRDSTRETTMATTSKMGDNSMERTRQVSTTDVDNVATAETKPESMEELWRNMIEAMEKSGSRPRWTEEMALEINDYLAEIGRGLTAESIGNTDSEGSSGSED